MKKYIKIFEVILLFVLSLTPLLWLKNGEIILGHDAGFRLNPISHLINLFYSWDTSSNFGTDWSWFKGFLVVQTPEALFISLTKSFAAGQILTFIFWFFCIGFSMYIFVNGFFKEKKYWFFRIFSSVFYMYNFFLLQGWFIAERAKFSLFCAIPLGVLSIYKTLTKEYSLLKGIILFSLISFLFNAGGNPTFYGAFLLTYGITFIYLTVANVRERGYREIIYSLKVCVLFAAGFMGISLYWVLPQLYSFLNGYGSKLSSVGGIESIITWESVITQNASFINLLRLQGMPDWHDNSLHTYASFFTGNPLLVALSFVPLFILLFGLMYHKRLSVDRKNSRLLILMLLLLIFGLFFTAGSHPPLGKIYIFFIKFIPGFAIFRSAFYKFGTVLWFSYIFIISYYLSLSLSKVVKRKKTYMFLAIFSFCLLLAYHFPFFNSNFFVWNKPFSTKLTVPGYVKDMTSYINKMPADTRILILPEFDGQADGYQWGFWGVDTLPHLLTNKSVIANSANFPEIVGSIYSSISRGEEDLFLRLVGKSGIVKALWRDDVLYSDKIRTSKSFISVKNNLENFNGVTLERKIGSWTLYSIKSPYYTPVFSSVDSIMHVQSGLSRLGSALSVEEDIKNRTIIFDESLGDKEREILSFSSKNIIGANCIACGSENFSLSKGGLLMPELKIFPTSPLYYLTSLREKQIHELHKDNPKLRVDADLGYSNKRIVEMKEIANAATKNSDERFFVTQAVGEYKKLINDALAQANTLSEMEKNEAFMKISIYLNSQFWYLSTQKNLYDYALEDFEDLSIFIQKTIHGLTGKIWATDFTENNIRYFLNLDGEGVYDLYVETGDIKIQTVSVDGEVLTDLKDIILSKGAHKIEVSYPAASNLIGLNGATESGELSLKFGDRVKIPINNFDPKDTYFISFDYKILYGRPNASVIEKGGNKDRVWNLLLKQNSFWNTFSSAFSPNTDTKLVDLEFYPTGFETEGGAIQLGNLRVIKVYVPEVFVSTASSLSSADNPPAVSSERLNPTMYEVAIDGSSAPFILALGETYSIGWRAYVMKENRGNNSRWKAIKDFLKTFVMKPIPESKHYILNGYSNGWLIEEEGNYNIIVEYFPQKIFYAGLIISGSSLAVIFLILLKRIKKHEYI